MFVQCIAGLVKIFYLTLKLNSRILLKHVQFNGNKKLLYNLVILNVILIKKYINSLKYKICTVCNVYKCINKIIRHFLVARKSSKTKFFAGCNFVLNVFVTLSEQFKVLERALFKLQLTQVSFTIFSGFLKSSG